jgi:secreted PhoX family phosphatase
MSGGGSFGSSPDHLLTFSDGMLYFTEDGGESPGIYVYDGFNYKTLLEATSTVFMGDETTGIAFSPDHRFMIFCLQHKGQCFQASRIDGQPFGGRHVLKWKYRL